MCRLCQNPPPAASISSSCDCCSPRKSRSASLPNQRFTSKGYRQHNDRLKNSEIPPAIWERCCHLCPRPYAERDAQDERRDGFSANEQGRNGICDRFLGEGIKIGRHGGKQQVYFEGQIDCLSGQLGERRRLAELLLMSKQQNVLTASEGWRILALPMWSSCAYTFCVKLHTLPPGVGVGFLCNLIQYRVTGDSDAKPNGNTLYQVLLDMWQSCSA